MYNLNHFNFKEKGNNILVTNDIGEFVFLTKNDFYKLLKREELDNDIKIKLIENDIIYEESKEVFVERVSKKLRIKKSYLFGGTVLHIFVVTKNCNYNCVYCQAKANEIKEKFLMDKETAERAVDIALQSPNDNLTFEFQGGEPLINFDVIKHIVEYTKEKNKSKNIEYSLVSNLSLLTDEIIDFCIDNNISISTSLDGDEELQNYNRRYSNNSYEATVNGIKRIKEKNYLINAIETTTRYSLNRYKDIVEEYIKLGFSNIFIRPLTKLGQAYKNWDEIGYTAEEFLAFYKNILDYIIEKNKEGVFFKETLATIFLRKILTEDSDNYMELRSPCGGAIGQLAYYYDGKIFTCDEGRMLYEMGNDAFKLGTVDNSYKELMKSKITETMCKSSCLECINKCETCAYMPYCGTCPVCNLANYDNIFVNSSKDERCMIYGGILDIIFDYIQDKDKLEILERWL